jgi:hypothetical protein
MVWHVDKYKITFNLFISYWTNEISFSKQSRILFPLEYFHCKIFIHERCLENEHNFQENHSRPGVIDARTRYRAAARRLRNIALEGYASVKETNFSSGHRIFCEMARYKILCEIIFSDKTKQNKTTPITGIQKIKLKNKKKMLSN